MTSIYIDDWPVGGDFTTEEDGRVLVTILQEFSPNVTSRFCFAPLNMNMKSKYHVQEAILVISQYCCKNKKI